MSFLTVGLEALMLLVPCALVLWKLRPRTVFVGASVWLAVVLLLRTGAPSAVGVKQERVLRAANPPGALTKWNEWQPFLDRPLTAAHVPWSSGFFPYWFGGEGGRWLDSPPVLISRTLFRVELPPRDDVPVWNRSPTEKYDLAVGDPQFLSTLLASAHGHNASPRPRFWFGLCNGVAAASLAWPEPFRAVERTSPSGARIVFHPYDVKALLASAYYWTDSMETLGASCDSWSFDPGFDCAMNPAVLMGVLINRLGVEGRSFLIDVHPSRRAQYYAVASARISQTRAPYLIDDTPSDGALKASQLVDVEVSLVLSSTTLAAREANEPASIDSDYQKVGLRPVEFTWRATLALDAANEVIGGRWLDDGPDHVLLVSDKPLLTDAGTLEYNRGLEWARIESLARESAGLDAGD